MELDNSLTFGDYLAALKRRRMLALYVTVPIIVVGAVLAIALPTVFKSTAEFRLVTDRLEAAATEQQSADEYVLGLGEKLLTSDKVSAILTAIQPYPDLKDDRPGAFSKLHSDVEIRMVTQTLLDPTGGRERIVNTGFTLSYQSHSAETAEKVATELTKAFVDIGRTDRLAVADNKVKFFNTEAERVSKQIAQYEQRLADFKSANFDRLPESAQASVITRGRLEQELDGIDREIRTLQQNRVFVAQQLRQAQAGPTAGNLQQLEEEYARKSAVYADSHPDMIALRRQIESLRRGGAVVGSGDSVQAQIDAQKAVLAEARQRYSEDHPDIRRLERNISALEARQAAGESGTTAGSSDTLMSAQLKTQLNATDTQIAGLQAQGASIRAKLSELEAQLGATPEVERAYESITRGLGSARAQYDQMIGKRLEAEVDAAAISSGSSDRFRLLSPPGTPWAPSGPPRLGIFVVSLLLGVILALSAVVAAEMFDSSVRGARDIRSLMGRTPLAVVPEIHNSVYARSRSKRYSVLAACVAIGAPILFLIVRVLST